MTELSEEARRQKLDEAVLARILIRDGLARYNAVTAQILEKTDRVVEQIDILQQLAAGVLHMTAEQLVIAKPAHKDESAAQYTERLVGIYREMVFGAVSKGTSITVALQTKQGNKGK